MPKISKVVIPIGDSWEFHDTDVLVVDMAAGITLEGLFQYSYMDKEKHVRMAVIQAYNNQYTFQIIACPIDSVYWKRDSIRV